MGHRIRAYTPEIDRESLTLYGGLFLVVVYGQGLWTMVLFDWGVGNGFGLPSPSMFLFGSLAFGVFPAALSVLFLRVYRYAYPPE